MLDEKCFYSGLPYWCDLCPELDDLQEEEKCPNGVCKSDLEKHYVKSRDEVVDGI